MIESKSHIECFVKQIELSLAVPEIDVLPFPSTATASSKLHEATRLDWQYFPPLKRRSKQHSTTRNCILACSKFVDIWSRTATSTISERHRVLGIPPSRAEVSKSSKTML